ncbi:MAG: hypothetical protein KGL73_04455 [Burkholderiales bacterium]|nr:hypothetical protein [Burkholderiales bacterium]
MPKRFLLALCLMLTSTYAASASFDCSKASSMIEIAICSDNALDALDVELADVYTKSVAVDPSHKKVQRDWLKKRNSCADNDCIRKAYEDRIRELKALTRAEAAQPLAAIVTPQQTVPQPSSAVEVVPAPVPESRPAPAVSAPPATKPVVRTEPPLVKSLGVNEPGWMDALDQWFRSNFVIIAGVVLLALIYAIYGYAKGCPSCRKWYAAQKASSELLGQNVEHRTVTRNEEHRDREGQLIKTVERKEQIQVTVSKHRDHYRCKYCGHEWSLVTTSESS